MVVGLASSSLILILLSLKLRLSVSAIRRGSNGPIFVAFNTRIPFQNESARKIIISNNRNHHSLWLQRKECPNLLGIKRIIKQQSSKVSSNKRNDEYNHLQIQPTGRILISSGFDNSHVSYDEKKKSSTLNRRYVLSIIPTSYLMLFNNNRPAYSQTTMIAKATTTTNRMMDDIQTLRTNLQEIVSTLQKLITNWDKAIIDCTYADVPRELLETKNKQLLLEKASTYALFDKSVSIVSCKTTNRIIRDYLGLTGIGPVVTLEKTLKQVITIIVNQDDDTYDTDTIEKTIQLIEQIQRDYRLADTYSYSARRDSSSINNFMPTEQDKVIATATDYIQTKKSIEAVITNLNQVIDRLLIDIIIFKEILLKQL